MSRFGLPTARKSSRAKRAYGTKPPDKAVRIKKENTGKLPALVKVPFCGRKISALFGKDATYPKTGRIRECADQKNTPRACSLTSSETENGMRVVYPRRAATIILVGHA